MQHWKVAGIALAVCACAGIWLARQDAVVSTSGTPAAAMGARPVAGGVLRIPALPAPASAPAVPVALDAALVRRAVREGTLRVALSDGTAYVVPIERQYTDETGHWNVVGRVATPTGPQPMVLTLGRDAVFGLLPMADGRSLRITTGPRGEVAIGPAGGIAPPGAAFFDRTDVVVPSPPVVRPPFDVPGSSPWPVRPHGTAAASPATRVAPAVAGVHPAAAMVDTAPVQVDVMVVYAPAQVALRGSVSAVEAEVANLFAIANQAHIDSGSRVRLRSVRVQQLDVSENETNFALLSTIAYQPVGGIVLDDLRDTFGADLVSLLRPHVEFDGTCGIAYLPGSPLARSEAYAEVGYSVVNVDGACSPLVFPHEIGHNLGSMHDRETDTVDGLTSHGAFVYSSGYRQPGFATVMAYIDGSAEMVWKPYFSSPASTLCGAPCGVDDYADNVRSLNRMATAIAAHRGTPGTVGIADLEALEPAQPLDVAVPIRLTGKAPTGGHALQVQVAGGTATAGVDYGQPYGTSVTIPEGERTGYAFFRLLPDDAIEGDETIALQVQAPAGVVVEDADAVLTIADDDPRHMVTGNLWFPGAPPTAPVALQVTGHDGPHAFEELLLSPPDFRYAIPVPHGAQVRLQAVLPDPLLVPPFSINEVRLSREWHLFAEEGVRVSGRVRAATGLALPAGPIPISFTSVYRNQPTYEYWSLEAPDYAFSRLVPRGAHINLEYTGAAPLQPYAVQFPRIAADVSHDIVLSELPTLRVCCSWDMTEPPSSEYTTEVWNGIYVDGTAPAGGISLRYRTVDGSAKAGTDYVAVSGTLTIPGGEVSNPTYLPVPVKILDDPSAEGPEYFDLVVDQVAGAVATTSRVRIQILSNRKWTGGPGQPQRP